ncbi:MAG: putative metal-binding motif-containing protein [Myxococcota bacterium]|nr:putative metal-binding motif-containing protein [Myxococcota bacterium]
MTLLWMLACFQTWTAESTCQQVVLFEDADGDGHGGSERFAGCLSDSPFAASAESDDDCDDSDPDVHPGAAEICDGVDQDCDGAVDNGAQQTFYADTDSDGYGDSAESHVGCEADVPYERWSLEPGDCDDSLASVHPGADELCDGVDQDCDGTPDNDAIDATSYYGDADGDGYGDPGTVALHCSDPGTLWSLSADDCDDGDNKIHPGAKEICDNGVMEDCLGGGLETCRLAGEYSSSDYSEYTRLAWQSDGLAVAIGEINGSSGLDVVIVSTANTVAWLDGLSEVVGTSTLTTMSPSVAIGELTGSEPSDLLMASCESGKLYHQPGPLDYPNPEDADPIDIACGGEILQLAVASETADGPLAVVGHPSPGKSLVAGSVELIGGDWSSGAESLVRVTGEASSDLGRSLLVEDLNADGVDDIVVAAQGQLYLLQDGLSGGLGIADSYALTAKVPNEIRALAPAGDALGDGNQGLWIGTSQGVWLWDGKVGDVQELGVQLVTTKITASGQLSGGVDVDSDGHGDLLLAGYDLSYDETVALFHGPFTSGAFEPEALIVHRDVDAFGSQVLLTPDLTGDASGDLLVTANGDRPEVFLYAGGGL